MSTLLVFAEPAASMSSSTALQPGRRVSKSGQPTTALSRLAKLAKTSLGMSPRQPLPQPPQTAALASNPLHAPADKGRAQGDDTQVANGVAHAGALFSTKPVLCAQAAAEQVVKTNEVPGMSQQAQQRQAQQRQQQQLEVSLHGSVNEHVAARHADRDGASRLSQAGTCLGDALICSFVGCTRNMPNR